ncbi:RsiW-degrading membrane proteinase PrsW (M82 family) [Friedmanniella endophytica]|uniref:RsiW-degrading membrane proteinase PrsW (M82 family) n=1 Tax=Microlunatus kandeliicorticis TaxID=1759536 RepID=A0A7W3IPK6_9ACTN|nr:PrsW family glutamic-type intramembrane protease [Microlunatus kandeliicorticis]MBA8792911.1 RsiW-degrading membrane proteinase PrsW (M82 family) [Microlunatus kandeliicorticis]
MVEPPPDPSGRDARERRQSWPRRLSWIAVLVAGVVAYLLVLRTMIRTENPNFLPSLILLGSIVVPATVLVFAASGGRKVLASPGLITLVAVIGGVIGTVAAGTLEYDTLVRLRTMSMIFVGLIEESVKLIMPVLVLIIVRLRKSSAVGAEAGVIIGVASGMGFATLETMGYGFTALLRSGSVGAVEQTLLLRAILSPAGHVAWTGMAAAAIWAIPGSRRKGLAVLRAVGVFVLVVLLHAAWDGFDSDTVRLIVGLFSFVALLAVIHRAHAGRRRRPHPPTTSEPRSGPWTQQESAPPTG